MADTASTLTLMVHHPIADFSDLFGLAFALNAAVAALPWIVERYKSEDEYFVRQRLATANQLAAWNQDGVDKVLDWSMARDFAFADVFGLATKFFWAAVCAASISLVWVVLIAFSPHIQVSTPWMIFHAGLALGPMTLGIATIWLECLRVARKLSPIRDKALKHVWRGGP